MRERVMFPLGAEERPLLPAFEVADAFESRHGSLLDFLARLMEGKASLPERAFLILEGLKAGAPEVSWDFKTVAERMWEQGHWDEALVLKESEFIERLMYTPQQYIEKKAARAAEAERQAGAAQDILNLSSNSP